MNSDLTKPTDYHHGRFGYHNIGRTVHDTFIIDEAFSMDTGDGTFNVHIYFPRAYSDNIPLEILLPLTIHLNEVQFPMMYDDTYSFTQDNKFLYHGWRIQNLDDRCYIDAEGNVVKSNSFTYDRDSSKLFLHGHDLKRMFQDTYFIAQIEQHPTVVALRKNELHELPVLEITDTTTHLCNN